MLTLERLAQDVNYIVDNHDNRRIGLNTPLEGEVFLREEEET
jgi:hypothetical protein